MKKTRIPAPEQQKSNSRIPPLVAVNPAITDHSEKEGNFLISFTRYNTKECGIENLQKNGHKKALRILIDMGFTSKKGDLRNKNIDTILIRRENEYTKLYNGLPPDSDLLEHKLQGTERIFYYIVDPIIFIVAITAAHYETKKK